MNLLTEPVTEIKGKTIKDLVVRGENIVLTFTDGTWCLFNWDADEFYGPSEYESDLNLPLDECFRLGLVSEEDHNVWLRERENRRALQDDLRKQRRHQDYLKLQKEFGELK